MNTTFEDNIKLYDHDDQQNFYDTLKGLTYNENWIVEQFFPKGNMQLLDMGCGAARTTIEFDKLGYITTGIDISKSLLTKAKTLYPHLNLQFMDATQTLYSDNSFDIIVFSFNGIDCIYPASLRFSVFDEVYRLLKPNGVFYYTSHSVRGMVSRELNTGKKGIKQLFRFLRNQKSLSKCLQGFWNHKEGNTDNILYAKSSARNNTNRFDSSKWKLLQVIGSQRYRDKEKQILFDGHKWIKPYNTAHNHFVLQKQE